MENRGCLSPCPCHCHSHYRNQIKINKSEIDNNIYTQNPNSEYSPSNYGKKNPLFKAKEIINSINSPILNNRNISRKLRLMERAQSIKDKINSKYFLKNINKPEKNWNDSLNNISNYTSNYTCRYSKSPVMCSMPTLKKNINNVNIENKILTKLLSKVPRHEKSQSKSYINNLRQSFSNEKYRKIPNTFKSYANTKKYQGYTSVIMPPNDLDAVAIKNTIYT
jgi:hypothetical protein